MKKVFTSFIIYLLSLFLLLTICRVLLFFLPGNVHLEEYQTIQITHQHDYLHSWVEPQLTIFQAVTRGLDTTLQLGLLSLFFSYLLAFVFTLLVFRSSSWIKKIIMQSTMVLISLPTLFIAPILIYLFVFRFNLLPAGELNVWQSYLLPIFVLMIRPTIHLFRMMRSQLIDLYDQPFIIVARAKGLSQTQLFVRHLIPHLVIPVIAYSPQMIISIVSGSFVVETLFAIPGAGFNLIKSMEGRDYPVILSYVFLWGGILLLLSRIAEMTIHFLDPRRSREVFK